MEGPWKMQFLLDEIILLVSGLQVSFQHVSRSANEMADRLAKQEVDWPCNLSAPVI